MAEIKPAEISAILRQQLAGFTMESDLEEVGSVLQVGDGIARIYGLNNAQSGELVEFTKTGVKAIVLNLEEDNVGVVLLGDSHQIKEGDVVKRTNQIASINVGEGMLGRVINTIGEPIDGKGPIKGETYEMPLERKAPGVIYRQPVNEPLQTGIKPIDDDYYTQPGKLFRLMSAEKQALLFANTAAAMGDAPDEIKIRHIDNCTKADPGYGEGVANALGIMHKVK